MGGEDADARPFESLGEVAGVDDDDQLRPVVGKPAVVAALVELQVIEVDRGRPALPPGMGYAGHAYHAARRTCLQRPSPIKMAAIRSARAAIVLEGFAPMASGIIEPSTIYRLR